MNTIAATNSVYSAVSSLLNNTAPSRATGNPSNGPAAAPPSAGASGNGIADSLNLSDHAKAVLARVQVEQVAANQLQTFLRSSRNSNGFGDSSGSSPGSGDGTQIFDQLTGQKQSRQGDSAKLTLADLQQAYGVLGGLGAYARALDDAHRGSDGTVPNFSQTLRDVVVAAPSTQQQIAGWYQSIDEQQVLSGAQASPDDDPGLAEALISHSVSFLNSSDIPDLNFHNTISLHEGEHGGSEGEIYTYNHNAAIFSDPTTSYKVLADGIVLSWKTPPASAAESPS